MTFETMENIHSQCIRKNFHLLMDCVDTRDIVDWLYQEGTITSDEAQEYGQSHGSIGRQRRERTRELLYVLQTRQNAYDTLVASLSQVGTYDHVVRALQDTEKSLGECRLSQVNNTVVGIGNIETQTCPKQSLPTLAHNVNGKELEPIKPIDHTLTNNNHHLEDEGFNARNKKGQKGQGSVQSYCTEDVTTRPWRTHRMTHDDPQNTIYVSNGQSASAFRNNTHHVSTENLSIQCSEDVAKTNCPIADICHVHMTNFTAGSHDTKVKPFDSDDTMLSFLDDLSSFEQEDAHQSIESVVPAIPWVHSIDQSSDYEADQENHDVDTETSDGSESENWMEAVSQTAFHLRKPTDIPWMPVANRYQDKKVKKFLLYVFDDLSSMVNEGNYRIFLAKRKQLLLNNPHDFDLKFLLLYLSASFHLWKNEYDKCENVVRHALTILPRTSNPSRSLVEILSSRCWMYFQEKKLNCLSDVLDDALQVIHQDTGGCVGMAAGWIFVDKARLNMAMLKGNNLSRLYRLRREGIKCLESALHHFKNDNSKDGPFGYGFAGTMMASLLLACGDRMDTLQMVPSKQDITRARDVLTEVEDSPSGVPGVLMVHVHLAKCDYYLRKGNRHSAIRQAKDAKSLAETLSMTEQIEYADCRIQFLQANTALEYTTGEGSLLWHSTQDGRRTTAMPEREKKKRKQSHVMKYTPKGLEWRCLAKYILLLLFTVLFILVAIVYILSIRHC